LEIRYAAAVSFQPGGLPAVTESARAAFHNRVVTPLLAKADDVRATGGASVIEALRAACDHVRGVDLSDAGVSRVAIAKRVSAFLTHIEGAIANGVEAPVPTEINCLFASLDEFVAKRYERSCSVPIARPKVFMDLGHLHSDQTADALDASAITASCRLKDEGVPISIVKLSVRDDSFDWQSACQLPYALAHELLCHAYQGVESSTGKTEPRVVVDGSCAWTEGWMDVLALWAATEWLEQHEGDPEWVARESGTLRVAFTTMHARRAAAQSMLPRLQRERRTAARRAVDHLLAEMRRFYAGPDREDRGRDRVYAFSLSLNALRIPQADRDRLLDKLALALDVTVGLDRDELISALVAFSGRPDWGPLDRTLTRLSGWA